LHLIEDKCTFVYPSIFFKDNNSYGIDFIDKYDVYTSTIVNGLVNQQVVPQLKHAKFISLYHSLPEEIFYNIDKERSIDIYFSGAIDKQWYPLRNIFHKSLLLCKNINYKYSLTGGDVKINNIVNAGGTWEEMMDKFDNQLMDYADNLRNAKISVFCDSIFKYPLKKYIECMACGCLILAPKPQDADYLGFRDGVNMVCVNEIDYLEKVYYYLLHEEERKRITDNAYKLFQYYYTCKKSAEIFLNQLIA
jgi:hypothetical protein